MGNIVLAIILSICLYTDIRYRKILNIITLPTIVIGLIYNVIILGIDGVLFSGKGLLVGFSLLFIPFLLGGIGAGDVKLMAAIGALMGTSFVFYSFIYTALIGGVISIALIFKSKGFKNSLKSFYIKGIFFSSKIDLMTLPIDKTKNITFPYGVAIVLGTFCTLVWGGVK